MNQELLLFFARYIEKELGIIYQEASYFQLEHRLEQIAKQNGYQGIEELFRACKDGVPPQIKDRLLDIATNNETSFFRDGSVFKALSGSIFKDLLDPANGPAPSELVVWSAACSSGQEAVSIAIEYDQFCKKAALSSAPPLRLLLTDISGAILERAKQGVYSSLEVDRGMPLGLRDEYFDQIEDGKWRVKPFLRRGFEYKKLNLLDSFFGFGPFHIVFCRNVLIYQNIENKKIVLDKIHQVLAPRGFLFLGAAESMIGLSEAFEQVSDEGAVFFRRKN